MINYTSTSSLLRTIFWITSLAVGLTNSGCTKKSDPASPAIPKGQRVILTPANPSAYFSYYAGADTPGPDQPLWVAASYNAPGADYLLTRIDTAGQVLCSRAISVDVQTNAQIAPVAALSDGSCIMTTQQRNGQTALLELGPDGTTNWNLLVTVGSTQFASPVAVVSIGTSALLYSTSSQDIFTPVAANGTLSASTGYTFPAQATGIRSIPVLKALPGGTGAILFKQLNNTDFLLLSIDSRGSVRWMQQLTIGGFTDAPDYFDLAVVPGTGSLVVLVATQATKQAQLVRLSPTGALLGAIKLAPASGAHFYAHFGRLAAGPQAQAAWVVEEANWLSYYALDNQNRFLASTHLIATPGPGGAGIGSLNAYGLVGMGATGATYGFGNFTDSTPQLYPNTSLNFLHISPAGQAGCDFSEAAAFISSAATTTQVTAVAIPAAKTVAVTALPNAYLGNNPVMLTPSVSCP